MIPSIKPTMLLFSLASVLDDKELRYERGRRMKFDEEEDEGGDPGIGDEGNWRDTRAARRLAISRAANRARFCTSVNFHEHSE